MWKNKPFQKGLGTGLIAGALLLQLMITVGDSAPVIPEDGEQPPAPTDLTAQMVIEQADALNLQVFEKGIKLYRQQELDDAVVQAAAAAKAEGKAEAEAESRADNEVTVFITAGMSAANVADYLFRSGVVADRSLFEQTMKEKRLNTSIRTGLYTFQVGHDMDDVIAQLTTPPSLSTP